VYGVPDQRICELMYASLIVKKGAPVTEADIKTYNKRNVYRHFKILKFIEKDAFPKTASGKVQMYRLREMAMQRISDERGPSISVAHSDIQNDNIPRFTMQHHL
ncbi:acyl-CoA synthetase family member 2, mitochondrial, partial [Aphis craccivora]